MRTLSLRLPSSLHAAIKTLAKDEGISINQFIASAAAEKMPALLTEKYLLNRASRGNETAFLRAMEKVADIEPEPRDKL